MGLKEKNNPLGQHVVSDHVGATNPAFQHGQSAELVEQVRKKAAELQREGQNELKKSDK